MKLNINKDQILKHKFWIMLLVAIPLILVGQFMLLVPVAGEIDTVRKKVISKIDSGKKTKGPFVSQANIDKKLAEVAESVKDESTRWSKVFQEQAGDLFWPERFEKLYPVHKGKFLRELKYIEPGETPSTTTDPDHTFVGKLIERDNSAIVVQNKDGKKEKFYRVANKEMNLKQNFFDLTLNKDVEVLYQTARYFNDKFHETEQSNYTNSYASQIRSILDIVDPVNEDGEGVVQLRDWPVPKKLTELPPKGVKFLQFTHGWDANADISEEAWLAQENLWIQKEFYRLIRQANDFVGKMEGTPVEGKDKVATYKNPYFELKLKLLGPNKVEATIKNLQGHRQKLEVNFRVQFNDEDKSGKDAEKILVDGEPLDPLGTKDAKGVAKDVLTKVLDLPPGPTRRGIFGVNQVLTWESAAIRRIDQITIGSMSPEEIALCHRTFPDNTVPLVPEAKVEDKNPNPGAPVGVPQFAPGLGGVGGAAMLTTNGLIKNRYLEVNDQARRIPVAISLIVDQDHVDRVITAFENSKFRFLLNQILINRYPTSLRPPGLARDLQGVVGGPIGFPFSGPGPFAPPPPGPGVGGGAPQTGDEEMEANVELVLYGTVTLYERYPPRRLPKTEAAAEAK